MTPWEPGLPDKPRCGHARCRRLRMLGSFLAVIAMFCIADATHGHRLNLAPLIAAAICVAGWALAYTAPHPRFKQAHIDALVREEQQRQDIMALANATRECSACERGDGPCRCTEDCGQSPQCTGWYAEHERRMGR